jgi:hypothetical protein
MEEAGKSTDVTTPTAVPTSKPSGVTLRDLAEDDTEGSQPIPLPPPPPPVFKPTTTTKSSKLQPSMNDSVPQPTFRVSGTMSSIDQPIADSSFPSGFTVEEIVKRGQTLKRSNISRTPGGTPIRTDLQESTTIVTTQDMIAQALKKKFSVVHQKSPVALSPKSAALDAADWEEEEDRYLVDNNNKKVALLKPIANQM